MNINTTIPRHLVLVLVLVLVLMLLPREHGIRILQEAENDSTKPNMYMYI